MKQIITVLIAFVLVISISSVNVGADEVEPPAGPEIPEEYVQLTTPLTYGPRYHVTINGNYLIVEPVFYSGNVKVNTANNNVYDINVAYAANLQTGGDGHIVSCSLVNVSWHYSSNQLSVHYKVKVVIDGTQVISGLYSLVIHGVPAL